MVKSEAMINLIQLNLAKAGLNHVVDYTTLNIILSTIEEEISKPGHICVEGEWSVCPPWMIQKVKEIMG